MDYWMQFKLYFQEFGQTIIDVIKKISDNKERDYSFYYELEDDHVLIECPQEDYDILMEDIMRSIK